jgi:hypothetical protein
MRELRSRLHRECHLHDEGLLTEALFFHEPPNPKMLPKPIPIIKVNTKGKALFKTDIIMAVLP